MILTFCLEVVEELWHLVVCLFHWQGNLISVVVFLNFQLDPTFGICVVYFVVLIGKKELEKNEWLEKGKSKEKKK